jgi:hypothetical protein
LQKEGTTVPRSKENGIFLRSAQKNRHSFCFFFFVKKKKEAGAGRSPDNAVL